MRITGAAAAAPHPAGTFPFATLAIGESEDGSFLLPVHGEKVPEGRMRGGARVEDRAQPQRTRREAH